MGISHTIDDAGIAEVVMDNPPVNALTVAGWYDLAATITALGDDPRVRVVVLRAEGRGFNAGVDIKEMQESSQVRDDSAPEQGRFGALIGAAYAASGYALLRYLERESRRLGTLETA